MATTSQVKADLDSISQHISGSRSMLNNAKANLLAARNQLAAIPATYSDTISTIDGYTPTGAFETLSKDEKAKLATEFTALKGELEDILDGLGVSYS